VSLDYDMRPCSKDQRLVGAPTWMECHAITMQGGVVWRSRHGCMRGSVRRRGLPFPLGRRARLLARVRVILGMMLSGCVMGGAAVRLLVVASRMGGGGVALLVVAVGGMDFVVSHRVTCSQKHKALQGMRVLKYHRANGGKLASGEIAVGRDRSFPPGGLG
jgi:hypothetical protein